MMVGRESGKYEAEVYDRVKGVTDSDWDLGDRVDVRFWMI